MICILLNLQRSDCRLKRTLKKTVLVFSAGGSLPPGAEEAYEVMEDLNRQIKTENQVASD
ncbi:hypothetical protein IEQ34_002949 [Dendrobium chrysotoxum]|uniref:Uncharacterized protein n=1 Tax=Dendrobium chrysotoxum TaxID=161865 RepID=A0AAV7HHC1_DENCH|nr:hypothetical protein IEQ34_002949 [Dendrobium chrysotoxum]